MIYIINRYPRVGSRHFWQMDSYIRRFLRALEFKYCYISPASNLAQDEDQIYSKNYQYHEISETEFFLDLVHKFVINKIKLDIDKKILLFFPWLPQFEYEELEYFLKNLESKRISIVGITSRSANAIWHLEPCDEIFLHQALVNFENFKILWIWEPVPERLKSNPRIKYLPEYAEVSKNLSASKKYDIGFFGLLSSYRGLFEIFIIALFNPALKIYIKGYSFSPLRVWRPVKFRIFRYNSWKQNLFYATFFSGISYLFSFLRFLPNVTFSATPFSSEEELDVGLLECKTIFYCAKLPHSSGLVTKALSAGIPVFWNGKIGQAFEFLKNNYPEGYFRYQDIFKPNKFAKLLKKLNQPIPQKEFMWKKTLNALMVLKDYI